MQLAAEIPDDGISGRNAQTVKKFFGKARFGTAKQYRGFLALVHAMALLNSMQQSSCISDALRRRHGCEEKSGHQVGSYARKCSTLRLDKPR